MSRICVQHGFRTNFSFCLRRRMFFCFLRDKKYGALFLKEHYRDCTISIQSNNVVQNTANAQKRGNAFFTAWWGVGEHASPPRSRPLPYPDANKTLKRNCVDSTDFYASWNIEKFAAAPPLRPLPRLSLASHVRRTINRIQETCILFKRETISVRPM